MSRSAHMLNRCKPFRAQHAEPARPNHDHHCVVRFWPLFTCEPCSKQACSRVQKRENLQNSKTLNRRSTSVGPTSTTQAGCGENSGKYLRACHHGAKMPSLFWLFIFCLCYCFAFVYRVGFGKFLDGSEFFLFFVHWVLFCAVVL